MLSDYSLQEIIEGEEFMYYEVNTREFGENSLMRGGYQFEGRISGELGSIYVSDIITADLIMKNENKIYGKRVRSGEILRKVYNEMLKHGAPFDVRDLQIRGDDIIRAHPHINLENLDVLLDKMLLKTALCPRKNNKQDLLVMAKRMINSKRDYYLEEC